MNGGENERAVKYKYAWEGTSYGLKVEKHDDWITFTGRVAWPYATHVCLTATLLYIILLVYKWNLILHSNGGIKTEHFENKLSETILEHEKQNL